MRERLINVGCSRSTQQLVAVVLIIHPSWNKVDEIKAFFFTWDSGFKGESTHVFSVFKIFHNMGQQITDNTLAGYPKFVCFFFTKLNAEMLEKVFSHILLVKKWILTACLERNLVLSAKTKNIGTLQHSKYTLGNLFHRNKSTRNAGNVCEERYGWLNHTSNPRPFIPVFHRMRWFPWCIVKWE